MGTDVEKTEELKLLLNAALGWKVRECGGAGECAFLAVASAIAWLQGKALDEAALAREAATLRLLAVGHVSKHKEFSEGWAPDPEEKETMTAGAPVPQTFKQYLGSAARKGYWADTFLLRALASRVGHPLIVWKWVPASGTWTRGVVAPWFKDGYAQGARKAKPIA